MKQDYLVSTIFLTKDRTISSGSVKTYNYIISQEICDAITVGSSCDYQTTDRIQTAYTIENDKGHNYRNSYVIFVGIQPVTKAIDVTHFQRIVKINSKINIRISESTYANLLDSILNKIKLCGYDLDKTNFVKVGDMAFITTASNATTNLTGNAAMNLTGTETWNTGTSSNYPWTYNPYINISELEERITKLEKKENKKEKSNMFENLTKNLKCGRAQDVRMSIYGPAFKGEDGNWYSVDADGELTDVTDLLFDMDSYCYMMPVAKSAIKEGDFILHNGHWVKVIEYSNGCVMNAVDVFNKQYIIPVTIKSPFGFEFYTKLVPLVDFSKLSATADTPFGALPMVLMMNNKNDKDMLPMLMMMGAQGGFNFDMSNPMMMYFLMKDGGNDSLLPFLMMSQMNKADN